MDIKGLKRIVAGGNTTRNKIASKYFLLFSKGILI
jgi:hypothetical protein